MFIVKNSLTDNIEILLPLDIEEEYDFVLIALRPEDIAFMKSVQEKIAEISDQFPDRKKVLTSSLVTVGQWAVFRNTGDRDPNPPSDDVLDTLAQIMDDDDPQDLPHLAATLEYMRSLRGLMNGDISIIVRDDGFHITRTADDIDEYHLTPSISIDDLMDAPVADVPAKPSVTP